MGFAGLWEVWHEAEDKRLYSCTIVTTRANRAMARVHNRMPAILEPEDWEERLALQMLEVSELKRLLAPHQTTGWC